MKTLVFVDGTSFFTDSATFRAVFVAGTSNDKNSAVRDDLAAESVFMKRYAYLLALIAA